jgi:hypothetical protein
VFADLGHAHVGIAGDCVRDRPGFLIFARKTLALDLPGRFYASAHALGGLAQALVAELLVLDARHFDMDIDAVQQGSGDTGPKGRDSWYFVPVPEKQI